jgi:hypothetical protein
VIDGCDCGLGGRIERMVRSIFWSLVLLTSGLSACTGDIGNLSDSYESDMSTGGAVTGDVTSTGGGSFCGAASSRRVRRLSAREYLNVVVISWAWAWPPKRRRCCHSNRAWLVSTTRTARFWCRPLFKNRWPTWQKN